MKKRILLMTTLAAFGYITLTSSNNGGGFGQGADGTKASGTALTCAHSGCHGSSTLTTVTVELDSASTPVTHYIHGHSYTLKITGTNTGTTSLPRFGFQITVVKAAGAGTSSAVNAGTMASTGLPTNVRYTTASATLGPLVDVVEHSAPIVATSGTGGSGTTYVESIPWTAPATSGTGSVVIYGCVNAVNFNGNADANDHYNSATPVTITELIPTEVASVPNAVEVKAFPNPVTNSLNVQLTNTQAGIYALKVFDLSGNCIVNETLEVNNLNLTKSINTTNWATGMYEVVVENNGGTQVIPVVKQ
jgi:hypothetical protein